MEGEERSGEEREMHATVDLADHREREPLDRGSFGVALVTESSVSNQDNPGGLSERGGRTGLRWV